MSKLIFVLLLALSGTAQARDLIAKTSSYVTIKITTARGGSTTRDLQPGIAKTQISYLDKSGGLANIDVQMEYSGDNRNAPAEIPVLAIHVLSLQAERSGLTSESSGGLSTMIAAREGQKTDLGSGLTLEVVKIEDRELYARLNPASKTFRASEAESYCLWTSDIAQCISKFEKK